MTTKDKDYVMRQVKEKNVRFIRCWFTDVLGMLKSFSISPSELEGALDEGMGFDGSSRKATWWRNPIPRPLPYFPGVPRTA